MVNIASRTDTEAVLVRQLGHLIQAGHSYEDALLKLKQVADGSFLKEVEAIERRLGIGDSHHGKAVSENSSSTTLERLAGIARNNGGDAVSLLGHAQDMLGDLKEGYRVYWAGVGAFLLYAAVLFVLLFGVLAVYSIFVFPQIDSLFDGFGADLPTLTVITMNILGVLGDLSLFAMLGVVVPIAVIAYKIRASMMQLKPLNGVISMLPGVGALCSSYNRVLLVNFTRLLTCSGVSSEVAVRRAWGYLNSNDDFDDVEIKIIKDMRLAMRKDPVMASLVMSRQVGTLVTEMKQLSSLAETLFYSRLSKLRESFTLFAQIFIGVTIGMLVISMYLPLFKMGSMG